MQADTFALISTCQPVSQLEVVGTGTLIRIAQLLSLAPHRPVLLVGIFYFYIIYQCKAIWDSEELSFLRLKCFISHTTWHSCLWNHTVFCPISGEALLDSHTTIDFVYCSPSLRCIQTTQHILQGRTSSSQASVYWHQHLLSFFLLCDIFNVSFES